MEVKGFALRNGMALPMELEASVQIILLHFLEICHEIKMQPKYENYLIATYYHITQHINYNQQRQDTY